MISISGTILWYNTPHLIVLDKLELRHTGQPHHRVLLPAREPRVPHRHRGLAERGLEVSRHLPHAEQVDELRVVRVRVET